MCTQNGASPKTKMSLKVHVNSYCIEYRSDDVFLYANFGSEVGILALPGSIAPKSMGF